MKSLGSSVIRQKGESQNGCFKKQSTPDFPKNVHFLPTGTHTRFEIRYFALLPTSFYETPEDLAPDDFANFVISIAATVPVFPDKLIIPMVRNSKIEGDVESNEKDGDDTIGASDKCLEKPTPIATRNTIKTVMDFSFYAESDKM